MIPWYYDKSHWELHAFQMCPCLGLHYVRGNPNQLLPLLPSGPGRVFAGLMCLHTSITVNVKFGTFHSGHWLRKSPRWVHILSPLTRACSTPACWPVATSLYLKDLTGYSVAAAVTEPCGVPAAEAQQRVQPGCQWGCSSSSSSILPVWLQHSPLPSQASLCFLSGCGWFMAVTFMERDGMLLRGGGSWGSGSCWPRMTQGHVRSTKLPASCGIFQGPATSSGLKGDLCWE